MSAAGTEPVRIETERLWLYPADRQQMEAAIAAEQDPDLQAAYREMLEGCLRDPAHREWYAMWMIDRKDGTRVGDLCFKGPPEGGAAEIGYGILAAFQGRGYATEAVRGAIRWAFRSPELTAVEAETDPDNAASQRVLAKCGFVPTGTVGAEGPRFCVAKN